MPPLPPPSLRRELQRTAETLLIATVGGVAVAMTGFPAGLVMGSMLAAASAALAGRPVMVMLPVARASFVLVGILLGVVVTPDMVKIVIGLPAGLALAGSTVEPSAVRTVPISLGELAVLLVVSTAVAAILQRVRFPGGLLFGALAGSAILHGTGLLTTTLPWWLGSAAIVTLGAVAGSRFANTSPRMLLGYLGAALGSFAVASIVAASFALVVVAFLPFRLADVVVAFAPGAQDTMMVLALALHLDPIYVGAHHLARFLVVSFTVAFAARRMGRRPPKDRAQ